MRDACYESDVAVTGLRLQKQGRFIIAGDASDAAPSWLVWDVLAHNLLPSNFLGHRLSALGIGDQLPHVHFAAGRPHPMSPYAPEACWTYLRRMQAHLRTMAG